MYSIITVINKKCIYEALRINSMKLLLLNKNEKKNLDFMYF